MQTKTDHVRETVRDLGWARDVCAECRIDWPCPTVADERGDGPGWTER